MNIGDGVNQFTIPCNDFLREDAEGFYNTEYSRFNSVNPGPTDFINHFKNTYDNISPEKLTKAAEKLNSILLVDLPQIRNLVSAESLSVCVVPRAKSDQSYGPNQMRFKLTVSNLVKGLNGFSDGTDCLTRHTATRTTHLPPYTPNYPNEGSTPYPGITKATCTISNGISGKVILLIDDIYTPGVNIDEDAIQTLLDRGANSVIFYAVARTFPEDQSIGTK